MANLPNYAELIASATDVTPGTGTRPWAPGLTVKTPETTYYYSPYDLFLGGARNTSGDQFTGHWFYPKVSSEIAQLLQSYPIVTVPDEWGKKALSFGWGDVSSPNQGYLLPAEEYGKLFANPTNWGFERTPDSNYYNLSLLGDGRYGQASGNSSTVLDVRAGKGTHTTQDDGGFLGDLLGLLDPIASILSFIPSPVQPLAAAYKAGSSLGQGVITGNPLQIVAGTLGIPGVSSAVGDWLGSLGNGAASAGATLSSPSLPAPPSPASSFSTTGAPFGPVPSELGSGLYNLGTGGEGLSLANIGGGAQMADMTGFFTDPWAALTSSLSGGLPSGAGGLSDWVAAIAGGGDMAIPGVTTGVLPGTGALGLADLGTAAASTNWLSQLMRLSGAGGSGGQPQGGSTGSGGGFGDNAMLALLGAAIGALGSGDAKPAESTREPAGPVQNWLTQAMQAFNGPLPAGYLDAILRPITQRYQEVVQPAIRGGAQAAGQLGSSRQGVAEGIAGRDYLNTVADTTAKAQLANRSLGAQLLPSAMANWGKTTNSAPATNPLIAALGGALAGGQMGNMLWPQGGTSNITSWLVNLGSALGF